MITSNTGLNKSTQINAGRGLSKTVALPQRNITVEKTLAYKLL